METSGFVAASRLKRKRRNDAATIAETTCNPITLIRLHFSCHPPR